MWRDPIVEEVRRVRQRFAARFGYDIHKMAEFLREEERHSGRKVVSFETKRRRKRRA